jgi:glutamate-1-semialdehyde 2,1-aminomutase
VAVSQQELVAELFTQRWLIDTLRELGERRAGSAARVEALRALDVTSPIFWPFHAPPVPLCVVEAQGSRIRDVDGHEFLDCHLGWGAQALHGHNPEPVVRAVREAVGRGTGNGYFHPIELAHARLLAELVPHCEKFAYFHSGTEATYAAVRLARAATGRRLVAKVEGGLHGVHDLAIHNTAFWYHGYPAVEFPPAGADGVGRASPLAGVPPAAADDLLVLPHNDEQAYALVERHRHRLAGVIAEPVSSAFPFEEVSIPFVRGLAESCRRARVPFILDEVLTGFRAGLGGMAARHGIAADLITYGKVISALGLPLAAVGGRADLLDAAQTSGMALADLGAKTCLHTTHLGNHLALVASHASLSLLKEKGEAYYLETRAKVGRLRERVGAFGRAEGIPIHLVGFGDFIGAFSLLDGRPLGNARDLARAINPIAMYVLTLLLRKRGVYTFSMPLLFTGGAHSAADLDLVYERLTEALLEMKAHDFPFVLPS